MENNISPCIRICKADNTGTYCTGCYRTLIEIQTWQWMTAEEKARTIALCETRRIAKAVDDAVNGSESKARRLEPCRGHDTQG